MPRVVPSQVVAFIDGLPNYHTANPQSADLGKVGSAALSCVLDLTAEIPTELLTMESATYARFVLAKAKIRNILETWNRGASTPLQKSFLFGKLENPLKVIRDALAKCPDEFPASSTSDLAFVTDAKFRTSLRIDIDAINRALSNSEWKAATVLAGSVIEALLLWALQQQAEADISAAVTTLREKRTLTSKHAASDLDPWNLHEYTEVAAHLGVIKPDTAIATRLAKDFRNLIHPGRAKRLAVACSRATALSCVAALEHVVADLK